jgi:tripartite-type tricarboxylate transporter receptor subunit TctC
MRQLSRRHLEWSYGTSGVGGPAMTDLMGGQVPMLFSSAGLPPEVVARLTQALQKAAEDKTLREQLNATGCDADFLTPAQTVDRIKADLAKWGRVVKEANIKAD